MTVATLAVLFLSLRGIAAFFTDYLWFDSLNLSEVWSGLLASRVLLFLLFSVTAALVAWVNLTVANRLAPRFRPVGPEEDLLERYFDMVGRLGRRTNVLHLGIAGAVGFVAGTSMAQEWNSWLLFTNSVDFGQKDPQFNIDIGFYVFKLPFLTTVVGWLFATFIAVLFLTVIAHYLNGGIRLQTPGPRVTPQVKAHLSVLLAVLALIRAAGYLLRRFELTVSERGVVTGAGYTDVKAELPAVMLLFFISILCCVLFLLNIRRRGWVWPILAVGLWGFVSVVAGSAYPWFVQTFQVEPSESAREKPYIERNIEATRVGFGLDKVTEETLDASGVPTADEFVGDTPGARSLENLRLLDPSLIVDVFQKRQGDVGWLEFSAARGLDVDRYQVDGKTTQVVIGARTLARSSPTTKSWEAEQLLYTHGYGIAMAPANVVENQEPKFIMRDLPQRLDPGLDATLTEQRARLYYSENLAGYSIVRTRRDEIGYLDDTYTYEGTSGVALRSFFRRAAFALRFGNINPLISQLIKEDSEVLFVRDVRERVQKVAPFLSFDSDPYPVVAEGRVVYVIDAYTTTNRYPYSQRVGEAELTRESGLPFGINYVRNSVKATVDAYTGEVQFYLVPATADGKPEPIASAYAKAFPELFKPLSEMPASVQAHLRHPTDVFRAQTAVYGRYHVSDANAFYGKSQRWNVAQEPQSEVTSKAAAATRTSTPAVGAEQPADREPQRMEPQYTLTVLPGDETLDYVNLRSFVRSASNTQVQQQKQELTAFMAARPDGRLVSYQIRAEDIPAPSLVSDNAVTDPEISREITLLGQQGSSVHFGDVMLLPGKNSVLWVMPMYVSAGSGGAGDSLTKLNSVIVASGPKIVRGATLNAAITKLFEAEPPPKTTDQAPPPPPATPATTTSTSPPTTSQTPGPILTLPELVKKQQALFVEANAALKTGDLALYQAKVNEAQAVGADIEKLVVPPTSTTGAET